MRPSILAPLALSLGLHAALGAWAAFARFPSGAPAQLIRISLRPGSGGDSPVTATAPDLAAIPRRPDRVVPRRLHASAHASHAAAPSALPDEPSNDGTISAAAGGAGDGLGLGRSDGPGAGDGEGTSQRPLCLHCPEPHYPLIARDRGWEGTVYVGLSLLADGTVETANVHRSSGYGVLDHAALAVARRSRFQPRPERGVPTPLRGHIEYRFQLSNSH